MTQEQIEGNKLIAVFMGIRNAGTVRDCAWLTEHGVCDNLELEYHASWDWLMPVVEKISHDMPEISMPGDLEALKHGTHGSEPHMEVTALPLCTPIAEVWEAVVKFIQTTP